MKQLKMRNNLADVVLLFLFGSAGFGLFPLIAAAGEEETINWEQCLDEAKRNNPDLRAAAAQVVQARAAEAKASSNFYPQVSAGASGRRSKSSGNEASDSYSYSLSASQLLFDGLKTWYQRDAKEQNTISAECGYESTSAGLRQSLRDAFVGLLRAQELIRITEDIAKRRQQQADLVQLRYDAGREHRGALLTAQANLSEAETDIVSARRDVLVAQRNLHTVLGRTAFIPLRAVGDFFHAPPSPSPPDFGALAEEHPAVRKSTAQKEAARYGLKSTWSDFSPSLSASGDIGRSGDTWPLDGESWGVGLRLSIPIFEGTSRFDELKSSRAALDEAEASLLSQRQSTLYSLFRYYSDFLNAHDRVAVQEQFFTAAEERSKIAGVQYNTGLLSFDNWIIIENDLVKAEKSLLQARADALLAEARWLYAMGRTLEWGVGSGE